MATERRRIVIEVDVDPAHTYPKWKLGVKDFMDCGFWKSLGTVVLLKVEKVEPK